MVRRVSMLKLIIAILIVLVLSTASISAYDYPQLDVNHTSKVVIGEYPQDVLVKINDDLDWEYVTVNFWFNKVYLGEGVTEGHAIGYYALEDFLATEPGLVELNINYVPEGPPELAKFYYCAIPVQESQADLYFYDYQYFYDPEVDNSLPSWDANRNGHYEYDGSDFWIYNSRDVWYSAP